MRKAGGWQNRASVFVPILLPGVALIVLLSCLSALASGAAPVALLHPGMSLALAGLGGPASTGSATISCTQPVLRRLTSDGRSIPWTWTPDGTSVLVKRPGRMIPGQQLFELWAVALQDGSERRLAENAIQPAVEDGRVAYLRYVERGGWEVVVAALADGQPLHVGAAQWQVAPAWIGGEVVYLRPTQEWGGQSGPDRLPSIAALPAPYTRALLSYDGQRVAATNGRRLWVVGPMGPLVIAQADQIEGFAWSSTAARLAYVRINGGPMPELWVWEAETGRSRMLARGELEHWEEPSWSPDGRTLAFVRRPTGNGGNTAGDIWLVNVDVVEDAGLRPGDKLYPGDKPRPGNQLCSLALTPTDEGSPRWSPEGRRLAFSMDGDTWIADPFAALGASALRASLDAPGLPAERAVSRGTGRDTHVRLEEPAQTAPVAPLGITAPLTIWVMHDGVRNTCRDVPDGQIDALPFEQYVKQVVPNEVPALWPMEVVKAQAVAARTYGWRKTLDRPYPAYPYTVRDSTADQYMCDYTHERSDAAVDATRGQYVGYQGKVIYSFYCAEAGDPTNYRMMFPTVPYLRSVSDPVGFGRARKGHSWGMSQWGAYRWALRHGWDYQQILGHYYTGAGVELSAGDHRLLAALTFPWPDHYVTGDRALLRANVSGAGVLTVTFSARLNDTWASIGTDTDASDGWGVVWPVDHLADTVTPSLALKAAAHDSTGQVAESGVSWVGLNRTPPTGTLDLAPPLTLPEVTTLTVPLALTAVDPAPDRGPIHVSLGSGDWLWEESALSWTAGEIVTDAAAGDGSAWHVGAGTAGILSGTAGQGLIPGQPHAPSGRAYFSLRAPAEALAGAAVPAGAELARLAVLADAGGGAELLGVRYVRGTDIKAAGAYQEFALDFPAVPEAAVPAGAELEWRVDSYGRSDLWVDRISVAGYPQELSPTATWTLPAREGPATITARFVDGAGNASPAVSLAVTVTDRSPPGSWRQFGCSGLTCAVQVRDAIAGLDIDRAAARVSGDGGRSWSDWLPAACTGQNGSRDWETLTIAVAGMPSPVEVRQIQFRVADRASMPNEGYSPVYVYAQIYLPIAIRGTY